jgi:hypothetical protein
VERHAAPPGPPVLLVEDRAHLEVFISQAETHIETIAHSIGLGDAGAVMRAAT